MKGKMKQIVAGKAGKELKETVNRLDDGDGLGFNWLRYYREMVKYPHIEPGIEKGRLQWAARLIDFSAAHDYSMATGTGSLADSFLTKGHTIRLFGNQVYFGFVSNIAGVYLPAPNLPEGRQYFIDPVNEILYDAGHTADSDCWAAWGTVYRVGYHFASPRIRKTPAPEWGSLNSKENKMGDADMFVLAIKNRPGGRKEPMGITSAYSRVLGAYAIESVHVTEPGEALPAPAFWLKYKMGGRGFCLPVLHKDYVDEYEGKTVMVK